MAVKSIPFESVLNGWVQKMRAETEKKEKGGKMGNAIFFLTRAGFFSYAQWSFFEYIKKTVSRLSRSYPLLFAIKILMVSQFGDL